MSSSAASEAMQPGDAPVQDHNSQWWEMWSMVQSWGKLQWWEAGCRNGTRPQMMGSTVVSEDTSALSWLQYDGVKVLPFNLFPFGMPSVETYNSTAQYGIKNIIQIMTSGARGWGQAFTLIF